MATDHGHTTDSLRAELSPVLAIAKRSDFFSVVALVERLTTEAVRVGGEGPAADEMIRFRHSPDLTFSASDISKAAVLEKPTADGLRRPIVEITTTFLGVSGAISPLPLYIAEEINHEDTELRTRTDFVDIFHHRLLSILYRSVIRYSPPREHKTHQSDPWMNRALALSGIDPEAFLPNCSIPPHMLLRLAPLIARRGRGAESLRTTLKTILGKYFMEGTDVLLKEFAGGWTALDPSQCSSLGKHNHALGQGMMLGKRTYDRNGRFAIDIGPLLKQGYDAFHDNGPALQILREAVAIVVKEPLEYDVTLRVSEEAKSFFRLSGSEKKASQLGKRTRIGQVAGEEHIRFRDVGNMEDQRVHAVAA